MNDFTTHARQARTLLERDMRALVDDAQALLRHAADDASAGYAQARQQLQERVDTAQQRLAEMGSGARERAVRGAEASVRHAREHSWQWIGAGVALVLVGGWLYGGRKPD